MIYRPPFLTCLKFPFSMKKRLPSIIGIIVMTIFLLLVNEFSDTSLVQDYTLIFILAGMFAGAGIARFLWKIRKLKKRKQKKELE